MAFDQKCPPTTKGTGERIALLLQQPGDFDSSLEIADEAPTGVITHLDSDTFEALY